MKKVKRVERDKAFIGAIISAVGSIAGGIGQAVAAKKQREAAEKQRKAEQKQANQEAMNQQLNAMNQAMVDDSYVDADKSRITLRTGGKKKITKSRSKKADGGTSSGGGTGYTPNAGEIIGGIGSAIGGVTSLISGLTQKVQEPTIIDKGTTFTAAAPKQLQPRNYGNNQTQTQIQTPQQINNQPVQQQTTFKTGGKMKTNFKDRIDVASQYACGGRKKSACGSRSQYAIGGEKVSRATKRYNKFLVKKRKEWNDSIKNYSRYSAENGRAAWEMANEYDQKIKDRNVTLESLPKGFARRIKRRNEGINKDILHGGNTQTVIGTK